jgi:hypothetical protein
MTFPEIKIKIDRLAKKIDVPGNILCEYDFTTDYSKATLEYDQGILSYFTFDDHGEKHIVAKTKDINVIIFHLFENITSTMASNYERENRKEGQDYRALLFEKQEKLLEVLNPDWAEIVRNKHKKILNPSDETIRLRKEYAKILEFDGVDSWDAWLSACKKYPST